MKQIIFLILFASASALAGFILAKKFWPADPPSAAASGEQMLGQPRPDFRLGGSDGAIVQASDFDGRIVLINFWATWCQPCREEMPMLQEFQAEYQDRNVTVVGIAMDDVQRVRDFLSELGITYTNLVGSADVMQTAANYGNRSGALPYSVLVAPDGAIRWTKFGPLTAEELPPLIASLSP